MAVGANANGQELFEQYEMTDEHFETLGLDIHLPPGIEISRVRFSNRLKFA